MKDMILQDIVDKALHKRVYLLTKEQVGETLAGKYLFVETRNVFQKNEDGMIRHLTLSGHMLMFRDVQIINDLDTYITFNNKNYVKCNLTGSVINKLFEIAIDDVKNNGVNKPDRVGGYIRFG